ncbi:hypothetical protein LTR17_020556 [Elasticomyces elasticus]|nr:hypothetical protein LTR17_020556 [Elasticomyces elasticus]
MARRFPSGMISTSHIAFHLHGSAKIQVPLKEIMLQSLETRIHDFDPERDTTKMTNVAPGEYLIESNPISAYVLVPVPAMPADKPLPYHEKTAEYNDQYGRKISAEWLWR